MRSKLPISLCMIAKNEEGFIRAALESVRAVLNIDEMIVADTGSTDRTKDIAADNGAAVFDFEWSDDFSAARNFAAQKARNDWILVLDADEEVISADIRVLASFIKDTRAVGTVTAVEMHDKATYTLSRLYNRKTYRFDGIIHEQITPTGSSEMIIGDLPVQMIHYGYSPDVKEAKGKLERNEKMLIKALTDNPNNPYLLYQLGKCYFDGQSNLTLACSCFEKALLPLTDFSLSYIYRLVECYGYALINTGQNDKALEHMKKYSAHYEGMPQFRFLMAHVLQNNGMFIEAVEYYESCIGTGIVDYRGITSFLSYYNMGVILECVGMTEDAKEMYKNCGDYKPAAKRLADLMK